MESSGSIVGGIGMATGVLGVDMDIARGLVGGVGEGVWCTGGEGLMGGGMYVGLLWMGFACIFGSYYGLGVWSLRVLLLACQGGKRMCAI